MSTAKTSNIQLNQWAAEDPFLREEFNEDNRKIDQAFHQVRWCTLLDVTTGQEAQQVDLDLSGITLTDYFKLELFFDCPITGTNDLLLRVNQVESGYGSAPCEGNSIGSLSYLTRFQKPCEYTTDYHLTRPMTGAWVAAHGHQIYKTDTACYSVSITGTAPVKWEELHTLSFLCADSIPAGSRFVLMGVKK